VEFLATMSRKCAALDQLLAIGQRPSLHMYSTAALIE
jgi:hypothetical protein